MHELWDEFPHEHEIYNLLLEVYKKQKNWSAAEGLILQYGKSIHYEAIIDESRLDLYLKMGDVEKAIIAKQRSLDIFGKKGMIK